MLSSSALIASLVNSISASTSDSLQRVVTYEQKDDLDTASATRSQAVTANKNSNIYIESKMKDMPGYVFSGQEACLLNANLAIGYIAFALSDLIFLYPGLKGDCLGQELKEYTQKSLHNIHNQWVKVIEMETRFGALQAVHGALAEGKKNLTVLTSSQSLLFMIPNLQALTLQRQPSVFHVASQSVDQDLVVSANIDAALTARSAGAIMLSSANAQEAHDMAIVAHMLSYSLRLPVVHFFNGVSATKQIEKVSLASYSQLQYILASTQSALGEIYPTIKTFFGQFKYQPFEYLGAKDAITVLIVLRASASKGLQHAVVSSPHVGLLNVRVFRPWSSAELIDALPSSTRCIIVLTESVNTKGFNDALYQDVAASIRFGPFTHDQRPRLVSAQAASFDNLYMNHIAHLVKASEKDTFINLDLEPFTEIAPEETYDGAWSAVFWDHEIDSTATAGLHNAHHVCSPHLTVRITRDGCHPGGPVAHTHLQLGYTTRHQFVAIHNVSLIKLFNTLSNAAQEAIVVLHGSWAHGDELDSVLTSDFKYKLTELNVRLYTINASRIAHDLGLATQFTHFVWEAVFLVLYHQAENAGEILARFYKDELAGLAYEVVDAVGRGLTQIDLLPTWKTPALETLPGIPLYRVVTDNAQQSNQSRWHKAAWQLMFREAYDTKTAVRPEMHETNYVLRVLENKRLTPDDYDRNVFHIELDATGIKYELGDALGVHGHNNYKEVQDFLDWYGLDGRDVTSVYHPESDKVESRSLFQLFSQTLDLFGRPSKSFYESMASFAVNTKERDQLLYLVSPEGRAGFKQRVDDTVTYYDILREFRSAKPSVQELVKIIAPIKPRHYSIASSQKVYKNAVHLLVAAVDWETKLGKKRYGQCTRYLSSLVSGDQIIVSIKPSVMKLPPLDSQPVIMAGLGTGMAPFRAFIQERSLAKATGKKIGPVILYFGSRHRTMEYLYGEELEAYLADGTLSHIGLAFSRDQKEKVYIQHKIMEDAEMLNDYLMNQNGHFYLCGPTWPVPDIKDAIVYGLTKYSGIDVTNASALIEEWKEKETYVLEVY